MKNALLAFVLFSVLMLCGCSQTDSKQFETGSIAGTFNGHPVEVAWKRDTKGQMVVDLKMPTALTSAAGAVASAATGGLSDYAGEAIAAIIAALTGGYALSERGSRKRAEQDADSGWSKFEAATLRERELALLVPPPPAR